MEKFVGFKKINQDAIIPNYAHEKDAGMDLYSIHNIIIPCGRSKLVNTGLQIELPEGTEAQVRSKSGIALKSNVFVLNSPGTIDESYKGEIGVILFNLGDQDYEIKKGQKIAQLVICDISYYQAKEIQEIGASVRGTGGFGSSGLNNNKK